SVGDLARVPAGCRDDVDLLGGALLRAGGVADEGDVGAVRRPGGLQVPGAFRMDAGGDLPGLGPVGVGDEQGVGAPHGVDELPAVGRPGRVVLLSAGGADVGIGQAGQVDDGDPGGAAGADGQLLAVGRPGDAGIERQPQAQGVG